MRGFLVSLGVHAVGVSALLTIPVLSTSELPPVTKAPPVTLPRIPATVRVAKPPLVTASRAPRGSATATVPRGPAQAPRPISDAPLDPSSRAGSVLDPVDTGEAHEPAGSTEGLDLRNGLPLGPGTGLPEPTRLARAHIDVQPPRRLSGPEPVYPPIAIQTHQGGRVILECTIDTDGRVVDIRVLRGHPLFEAAAVAAVERWLYKPTLLNGVPVSVLMTVTVDFHLR